MKIDVICAFIAGALHLIAYTLYAIRSYRVVEESNVVTWGLWGILTVFNVATYHSMSKDWVKTIQPLVGMVACLVTSAIVVYRGRAKFKKMNAVEWAVASVGLAVIIAYAFFHAATVAQLLVIAAVSIGFITTYEDVVKKPAAVWSLPWFIWTAAFAFGLTAAIMRMKNRQDLAYFVVFLPLHLGVGILALRTRPWVKPRIVT